MCIKTFKSEVQNNNNIVYFAKFITYVDKFIYTGTLFTQ